MKNPKAPHDEILALQDKAENGQLWQNYQHKL